MNRLGIWSLLLITAVGVRALPAQQVSAPHVQVEYAGIDATQAEAIANTLSAARTVYADEFGFDMPQVVQCTIECEAGKPTRLWTDGSDHVFLTLLTKSKLDQPGKSGVFNLYGMCHELGHVAMYRTLKSRDWLSSAAAEGWAHYAGSVVVDRVYELKGESLWPDKYDYRADGTARLDRQLAGKSPDGVTRAAGLWHRLDSILGRKTLPKLLESWESAGVDPADPSAALLEALLACDVSKADALRAWWADAAPLFVQARPSSAFQRQTIDTSALCGQPITLGKDDNTSDGKRSIAGSGHTRRFTSPGGQWYIVAVSVYGSRYGPRQAPNTTFDIALCDADIKPITAWKKPYSAFGYGQDKWVRFALPPTRVPGEFAICLSFRPTQTNGVYVHFDASSSGDSMSGLPGEAGTPLDQGQWMIRVELDQPKAADALRSTATDR